MAFIFNKNNGNNGKLQHEKNTVLLKLDVKNNVLDASMHVRMHIFWKIFMHFIIK